MLNSFGGPLIGMIVRMFDIVVKDIAQCAAIVFTCLMGFLILGETVPPYFWSGGAAVALGTYVYGSSEKVIDFVERKFGICGPGGREGFNSPLKMLLGGLSGEGSSQDLSNTEQAKADEEAAKHRERTFLIWIGVFVSSLVIAPSLVRMVGATAFFGMKGVVDDAPYLSISQAP